MDFLSWNEPSRKEYERLAEKASAQALQDREFFLKQIELDRVFFREKIDLLFSLHTILAGVLSLVTLFFGVVGYQNLTQFREASKQELTQLREASKQELTQFQEASKQELTSTLNTYQQKARSELSTTSTNALSEFDSKMERNIEQKLEGPKAKEFFDSSIERLGRNVFEPQIQALNKEIETMTNISRYGTHLTNVETATRTEMRLLRKIASDKTIKERTRELAQDQLAEVDRRAMDFSSQSNVCWFWYQKQNHPYTPSESRVLQLLKPPSAEDLATAKRLAASADKVCEVVLANDLGFREFNFELFPK